MPYRDRTNESGNEVIEKIANWAQEIIDNPFPQAVQAMERLTGDSVNHPAHYNKHPSGVEVIQITEHMNFCRGNVVKYVLRAGLKNDEIEDLRKAAWYLDREIKRIESARGE